MEQMTNLVLMRSYFPLPQCKLLVNPVLGDFHLELRHTCVCTCMHRHTHCSCAGKGCFHCHFAECGDRIGFYFKLLLLEQTFIFNCSDISILVTRHSLTKKIYEHTHYQWCLLLVSLFHTVVNRNAVLLCCRRWGWMDSLGLLVFQVQLFKKL